jgi:hypothetical protein
MARFKIENIKELFFEEEFNTEFEFIERTEWTAEHKYQTCKLIFKYNDITYCYEVSRSGSDFTDWNYDWDYEYDQYAECSEVKQIEVVTTKWVSV